MTKHPQIERIGELVHDSLYHVDERAIAEAIVARALARSLVSYSEFRNDRRAHPRPASAVRSFRPSRRVRSFHLPERRPGALHA
jgi:hypothetical protein